MKSCLLFLSCLAVLSAVDAQTAAPKPPATCTVQGQVVQTPGGQPIRKAAIVLLATARDQDNQSETPGYRALTDAEGHFKIEDVKPGSYSLYFGREGFVDAEKRHHGSGMQLWLEPGQEVKDLLFHVTPAAVIVGKVRDDDGDPISGVDVLAIPYGIVPHWIARNSSLGQVGQCSTDDLGECRISGLDPGRYLVAAARAWFRGSPKEGETYVPTYYPGRTDKKQAVPLDLRPGDELPVGLTLTLVRTFHVRGQVTLLPAWTKKEAAQLTLESEGRASSDYDFDYASAVIDENGAFDISGVAPGSYTVRLDPTRVPALEAYFDAQSPQGMRTDEIVRVVDGDVNDLRITPLPNGWVRGRLQMDSGQKRDWSDMVVSLQRDSAERWSAGPAGVKPDGSFERPVLAGSYHARLSRASSLQLGYYVKAVNLGGKDVADTGFAAGGANPYLEIVVSANAASIEGVVADEQGKPSSGVEVICIPEAKRRARRDLYRQVMTDARGHFSLLGLTPGEYQIFALDDDFEESEIADPEFVRTHESLGQTIELKEGEHKNLALKLAPSDD
jgi:protocatechuate 3,4-dioxygenase beta subunit